MEAAAKTQRQEQADAARASLIEAASVLFAERGYHDSSVAEIGARAGVSRGLVNHHFGSKENLLTAVIEAHIADWEQGVVAPAIAGKRGLEALHAILFAHLEQAKRRPKHMLLLYRLMAEASDPRNTIDEEFAALHKRWRALGKHWWDQGVEDGEIDASIDQDANASLIIGGARGITFDWLTAPGSFDLDAAYQQFWDMLAQYLTPR
ncbi:MAG: TetR family transcriptional regulator [Solirubrobacterales bacterium]